MKRYSNWLSSCDMCSGMVLFYKIPQVVLGRISRSGPEDNLHSRSARLEVLNDAECIR